MKNLGAKLSDHDLNVVYLLGFCLRWDESGRTSDGYGPDGHGRSNQTRRRQFAPGPRRHDPARAGADVAHVLLNLLALKGQAARGQRPRQNSRVNPARNSQLDRAK